MTRTVVTFECSAFNTTVSKEYFVAPDNYGDDLARWLMRELKDRGLEVEQALVQKDHGWQFSFKHESKRYDFFLEHHEKNWSGRIEPSPGRVASFFGRSNRDVERTAAMAVHAVLSRSPLISEVYWHSDANFEAGVQTFGTPTP